MTGFLNALNSIVGVVIDVGVITVTVVVCGVLCYMAATKEGHHWLRGFGR